MKPLLSPTFVKDGEANSKLTPEKPPVVTNTTTKSDAENANVQSNSTVPSAPTRRIRRPTSIRRPKLIGKSVAGSVASAVAASRNRARSTQFKNLATPPSSARKAPRQGSDSARAKQSATNSTSDQGIAVSRPPSHSTSKEISNDERLSGGIKVNISNLLSVNFLLRLGSLQSQVRLGLANGVLPISSDHQIAISVVNSMTCLASPAWSETCRLPTLPPSISSSFILLLGRWLASVKKNVDVLSSSGDSVVFRSEVRNVNGVKCCAIVQLSLSSTLSEKRILRSKGWILNLPRRPWMREKQKALVNDRSSLIVDRDGIGMDKVLSISHSMFRLSSVLFDFCSSVIERTARMVDDKVPPEELPPALLGLMQQYPYESQGEMGMQNYRAFEGTIVLKSYRDELIDMFDAFKLFGRMSIDPSLHDMICCGEMLCFKKNIYVKGTRTILFLSLFPNDATKMKLLFLCRTQGQNLSDFMFRDGSNVGVFILDTIAYEAGGLALRELHEAAKSILRDDLWESFSQNEKKALDTTKRFSQLISLVEVETILPQASIGNSRSNKTGLEGGLHEEVSDLFNGHVEMKWQQILQAMKNETIFSPYFAVKDPDKVWEVFYMPRVDVFLILGIDAQLSRVHVKIASRNLNSEQMRIATEIFVNFVVRFIWYML